MSALSATIVIATKNRRDDLRRTLVSCQQQRPRVAVLVVDDGSTDGTAEMVRTEFPDVRVECVSTSRGYIVERNLGARLATTDIVVSLDDDAVFSADDVVSSTLAAFDDDRVGAVAIPFVNVNTGPSVLQLAPDAMHRWVTDSFTGTAYAVRRALFLRLGGYREHLVHQGEEGDFCVRMLDAGRFVRLGTGTPILHYESPKRDLRRMDFYGSRNLILYCWQNVPLPYFPPHLAMTTLNLLRHGLRVRRLRNVVAGLLAGYWAMVRRPAHRNPVSRRCYRLMRQLKALRAIRLDRVLAQ